MTTPIELSVSSGGQPTFEGAVEQGVAAEELGYDRVWLAETWGRNSVVTLSSIAERTERIGIGSSILPVYSRSPALIGQTAATLDEASDGRYRLGLGPSGPAVIERWHGTAFERPLRRTREYVEIVRAVLAGDVVDYDGDLFELNGFRLRSDPPSDPPAIDVTGMGPKSVELAGRFADGWHARMVTPAGFRERYADLRRGASLAGRDPEEVRTTAKLTCCALADGDLARALARRHLAFYIGNMGTFYRDALVRQGHDVAEEIFERWQAGDRASATDLIDPDLLDELAPAGTPERARSILERFTSMDEVDAVAVSFPREASHEQVRESMAALAPA